MWSSTWIRHAASNFAACLFLQRTGDIHAVKTFSPENYRRAPHITFREFGVLQKLKHDNIVKLLAVEEEVKCSAQTMMFQFHPIKFPSYRDGMPIALLCWRELSEYENVNEDFIVVFNSQQTDRSKVIVMELCTGGSLYNILDDPANAYGLEETEMFRVLHDVGEHLCQLELNKNSLFLSEETQV